MFNNLNLLFIIILTSSSIIAISSNSWVICWLSLEINLTAFIPMISNYKNILSNESTLKYFLIQTLASVMLLTSSLIFSMFWSIPNNLPLVSNLLNYIIMIPLLMKMGAAPLHNWFISMIEGLNWKNSFILMTWQKFAPTFILYYCMMNSTIFISFILISAMTGAIGGLKQTSLKKILAYSSINHLSWIMTSMLISKSIFTFYLLTYSILNGMVILSFYYQNITFINQSFNLIKQNFKSKLMLHLPLLSMGGMPPLLGFLPKWLIIFHLSSKKMIFLLLMLITFSFITLYYYMQCMYSALLILMNQPSWNLWNFKINLNSWMFTMLIQTSNITLFIFPIMFWST